MGWTLLLLMLSGCISIHVESPCYQDNIELSAKGWLNIETCRNGKRGAPIEIPPPGELPPV